MAQVIEAVCKNEEITESFAVACAFEFFIGNIPVNAWANWKYIQHYSNATKFDEDVTKICTMSIDVGRMMLYDNYGKFRILTLEMTFLAQPGVSNASKLYIVWYGSTNGWRPSKPMSQQHAEIYAANMESEGYDTRIHPQLQVTRQDLIDG